MKPFILRQLAQQDYDNSIAYYLAEAGQDVAIRFVHAVDAALNHIALNPATGSPCYAELLAQPRLRSWLITRFSYIILYIEQSDSIDVIRIIHQHADIPAHLHDDENE